MKRLSLLIGLMTGCLLAIAQGIPAFRNFGPDEYHANNLNNDIAIGADGTVFVANLEGLLYYRNDGWHTIHTSDIKRITVVYRDKNDDIWAGGYNFFGKVVEKANGQLTFLVTAKKNEFHGEVEEIWEDEGVLQFYVDKENAIYEVKDDTISVSRILTDEAYHDIGLSDVIATDQLIKNQKVVLLTDTIQTLPLGQNMKAVLKRGLGICIVDKNNKELYRITEENGLCSNNVVYIDYDGRGTLWGAADDGIFAIAIPSIYSRFTVNEGLAGEVLSITEYKGKKYVGTNNGLFCLEGKRFVRIGDIINACWDLKECADGLLAATANGIYKIAPNGQIQNMTNTTSMSILVNGNQFYSGEMDGLYQSDISGNNRAKVCELQKTTKIIKDRKGTIWLQTIYGEIWQKLPTEKNFKPVKLGKGGETMATIVPTDGNVTIVTAESSSPFQYPVFCCLDENGVTWLTNNKGKSLYRWKNGKRLNDLQHLLHPFYDIKIHALYSKGSEVWIGTDHGIWIINMNNEDPRLSHKPILQFNSVILNSDSILWERLGANVRTLPNLGSRDRNLLFTYSVDYTPLVGTVLYRYKLNDGPWSAWADDQDAEFNNLSFGSHKLTIQALLEDGTTTAPLDLSFWISPPFYQQWYMILIYLVLLVLLVYALFRYRLHRLNVEKERLEIVVQERTAEVVKQKDEIEEKSKSLEVALDELNNAQNELIRQEKMATVGKLTQGLIDRILNPLNYINNFSKLSEGLVKDIEANIEDEKEHIDEDNYEDTKEVLSMLRGNLQKVGEHGQSTTRTLKAMEEMLKDRSGGIVRMNLTSLLRKDLEMLDKYYEKDIAANHINVVSDIPDSQIFINGNADQLSKTLMSLLGNGIYAIKKQVMKMQAANRVYQPELALRLKSDGKHHIITIRDNGTGIGEAIIHKIFDPFFTTKTTAEASGTGLYLSREIIQNHGGDIHVESVKNEYSEFTILLPALKE